MDYRNFPNQIVEDRIFNTSLARQNWQSKYQYGDETPLETFKRIANALSTVEQDQEYWYGRFLDMMLKTEEIAPGQYAAIGLKNTFGGRITANAGTEYAGTTLMNCFIAGPVQDATVSYKKVVPGTDKFIDVVYQTEGPDSLKNIMLSLLEQAETLKSEGGYGISFEWIRPRGSVIKGIGIRHPGVIHYMDIWDKVASVIVMGDNDGYKDTVKNYLEGDEDLAIRLKKQARKGAQMASLPIWHPDVEEFVRAKQEPGRLTKFNISVMIDDRFMNAVSQDDFYDLWFPEISDEDFSEDFRYLWDAHSTDDRFYRDTRGRVYTKKVYKRVKAKELYDLIIQSTYNRNEPGVLFYDNMQRNNPLAYLGNVNSTNPCGEIGGNPETSTVCLLGSVNLTQYVSNDRVFDWDQLEEDIEVFSRALDNVNDLTNNTLPQYNWATDNVRQYGMGLNGLGSALLMLGIPYNSQEALDFTERVTALKEEVTWRSSARLAEEKGPFPAYNEKFLETNWFTNFTKISEETKQLIRQHGVRNGKTTTNPPLGNSSVISDMVSNGIEPIFMMEYYRTYIVDKWPDGLTRENVKTVLTESMQGDEVVWKGTYEGQDYLYEPHNRGLCVTEPVRDYGYQWVLDNYPQDFNKGNPNYVVTTNELTVEEHVNIQEIVQRNCNQSVSKTNNLPNDYSYERFTNLYFDAWQKGLNGYTTYRDGTMGAVLSKIENTDDDDSDDEQILDDVILPAEFYNGETSVVKREGNKFYIHFSYPTPKKKRPVAIWITTNTQAPIRHTNQAVNVLLELAKDKGIKKSHIDAVREKIKENTANNRLARAVSFCLRHRIPIVDIVIELDKLEEVYVTDLVFAIKKFLSSYVKDGTSVDGRECSNCGSSNIEYSGGCANCRDCGTSGCA